MTVNWMEALAALVALGLFAYLGYALLPPRNSEGAAMQVLQDLVFVGLTVVCFVGLLGFVRALARI